LVAVESVGAAVPDPPLDRSETPSRGAKVVIASAVAERRRRWSRGLEETFAVCAVSDRKALEQITADLKPDVVVVDLALPRLGRVRGLRSLRLVSPSSKILVLTDASVEGEGVLALKTGARGYCVRTIHPADLRTAVTAIQSGEIWASRKLLPVLIAELQSYLGGGEEGGRRPKLDRLAGLTARQRVIADLIGEGARNKEIASQLNISERTVKAHLTKAFRYVGVTDRLQFALLLKGYRPVSG